VEYKHSSLEVVVEQVDGGHLIAVRDRGQELFSQSSHTVKTLADCFFQFPREFGWPAQSEI
jgi:hypothetical protein